MSKSYKNILIALGYNEIESNILEIIITQGNLNADQIINYSGSSRGKVYSVLKELEEKRIIYRTKDRPAKFSIITNFLDRIEDDFNNLYEMIKDQLIKVKRKSEGKDYEQILDIFQMFGYKIKSIPYKTSSIFKKGGFYNHWDKRFLFDYIAEGEYKFCISILDKTKVETFKNILETSIIPIIIAQQDMGCINTFFIIQSDFPLEKRFKESLSNEVDIVRTYPLLMEIGYPSYIGMEKEGFYIIKSSDDIKESISNILKEIQTKRSLIEQFAQKIRDLIEKIDSLTIESEVIARNLKRNLFHPFLKRKEKLLELFKEIRKPITEIIERERSNMKIIKQEFMKQFVEVKDHLDSLDRHLYIPSVETLNKFIEKLEMMKLRGESIKFELSSLEKNTPILAIFRHKEHFDESFINPFIFTVPFERKGPFCINQEEINIKLKRSITNLSEGASNIFRVILGNEGMGKTHILKNILIPYLKDRRILYISINCPLKHDLVQIILQEIKDSRDIPDEIRESLNLTEEKYTSLGDLIALCNEISEIALNDKYKGFVIILDEFENTIHPYLKEKIEKEFDIEPFVLRQLREILNSNISHFGVFTFCRTEYYQLMEYVLKIENFREFVLKLKPLELENIEILIDHKMKLWDLAKPSFSNEIIKELIKITSGNIRNIIKYCRELYRHAFMKDLTIIKKNSLKFIEPVPIFMD